MLIGQKVTYITVSRVPSLADAHTNVVDLKNEWHIVVLCYHLGLKMLLLTWSPEKLGQVLFVQFHYIRRN